MPPTTVERDKGYQKKYREKNKKWSKERQLRWRKDHRQEIRDSQKKTRQRRRATLRRYKTWVGCQVCGLKDHRCLDLHHRHRTSSSFNPAARLQVAWAQVRAEIRRCDVLCANCHRIRHLEEGEAKAISISRPGPQGTGGVGGDQLIGP